MPLARSTEKERVEVRTLILTRRAYSMERAAYLLDATVGHLRKLAATGEIETVRLGGRVLVPAREIRRLANEPEPPQECANCATKAPAVAAAIAAEPGRGRRRYRGRSDAQTMLSEDEIDVSEVPSMRPPERRRPAHSRRRPTGYPASPRRSQAVVQRARQAGR